MSKIELTRSPYIKNALKSRYPQLAVFIVMLAGYIFAILAGLIGTPVGSHNFSIVFVWVVGNPDPCRGPILRARMVRCLPDPASR